MNHIPMGTLWACLFLFATLLFAETTPVYSQDHKHHHPADTFRKQEQKQPEHNHTQKHTKDDVAMSHAFSLRLPMTRNGSGTGWLPDNSPMYGYMLHTEKWMYMFHGNLFVRYNNQDIDEQGTRGAAMVDAPNWVMAMGQRAVGRRGLFRFSTMLSLDPLTIGGGGYPLLYQSGETWQGQPLVDRQHPHDLFSELSVAYTHQFSNHTDAFVYLAYPGEPALGPVAFMHRVSSLYNPDAPLGHHWQDATHITFGVATLGVRHRQVKLEGSVFTGREPNEERYGFDRPRFDSYAVRFSYSPSPAWALQASQAWVQDVHESGPREDVRKTTASAIHSVRPGKPGHTLNSAFVWGYNKADGHRGAHSFLAETAWGMQRTTLYGKYEWVQKSTEDLLLEDTFRHDELFGVQALTAGLQHRLAQVFKTHLAVGSQASWYPSTGQLRSIYGANPMALQVYLRLYPALMSGQ